MSVRKYDKRTHSLPVVFDELFPENECVSSFYQFSGAVLITIKELLPYKHHL